MRIGDFSVKIIPDGRFYLDGGAMFGVVPKVLWEKLVTPDDKNRIPLALNCFLVQTGEANILIETGVGEKLPDKLREIYSIERQEGLLAGLAQYGLSPKDINIVILTHLHFDHCGGNTVIGEEGKPVPTFPNAKYVIQKGEWEDATNPSPLNKASYFPENFLPLPEHGQLFLIDGDTEIVPGIKVVKTGGHTPHHQIVIIESGGEVAVVAGDILPTTWHLKPAYIASYDLDRVASLEAKQELISRAVRERWIILWVHDPNITASYLKEQDDKVVPEPIFYSHF